MSKSFSIPLDCDHVFWYTSAKPRYGDVVWCASCGEYRGVIKDLTVATIVEDGYQRSRLPLEGFLAECSSCEYKVVLQTLAQVKKHMFRHISIEHGESSILRYDAAPQKKCLAEPDF